jgi:hypothetical protein
MRPHLFIAFGIAALLAGCVPPDTADMELVTDPHPVVHGADPNAFAIAQGAAVAVAPWMWHEEIEGSSAHPVTDARADDPMLLRVWHSPRRDALAGGYGEESVLVLEGLLPGTTTLRLYRDGSEVGGVHLEVVAQDP